MLIAKKTTYSSFSKIISMYGPGSLFWVELQDLYMLNLYISIYLYKISHDSNIVSRYVLYIGKLGTLPELQ